MTTQDPLKDLIVTAMGAGRADSFYDAAAVRVSKALRARFGVEHFASVDSTGWRLEHPFDCRLSYDQLDCPVHQAIAVSDLPFLLCDENGSGRYRAAVVDGYLTMEPTT